MSTPQERIQDAVKAALKAHDKERLGTMRMLLTEIKNEKIRRGAEVDETAFVQLVRKAIKQRNESATQFEQGDRPEQAAKERREAEILDAYLPQQADDGEIRQAVQDFVAAEDLSGAQGIGPVMRAMLARFGARADGGTINRIAREVLTGS